MFTFNFDQQAAMDAGAAVGLSTSGAHDCVITSAVLEFGKDGSQSRTMSVSVESHGQKANFIRFNFIGRDGSQIYGYKLIMALLWAAGLKTLNAVQRNGENGIEHYFPDLEGKTVGLVLQKVLYTKGDGSEGYKFDPKHVYKPSAGRRTYREFVENLPATEIDNYVANLTDKDERNKGGAHHDRGGYGNRNPAQGDNSSWQGSTSGGGWGASQYNPNDVPTSRLQQANQNRQNPADFDDGIPF